MSKTVFLKFLCPYKSLGDLVKLPFLGLPSGPLVKISPSNARDVGLSPGLGAKTPYVSWPKNPKHKTEIVL